MSDDWGNSDDTITRLLLLQGRVRAMGENLKCSVWALRVANQALRSSAGPDEIKNAKALIQETLDQIKDATK